MPTGPDTSTTHGARDHARAQAGASVKSQPIVPASATIDPPPGVSADRMLVEETLGAGAYCAHRLPYGARMRLTDLEGDGCAALMVHAAHNTAERLNVADTVKVQWQAYLGQGMALLSGMGRVLASIVEDTSGRHDALCGVATAADNAARYGEGGPWGATPAARDRLLLGLAKFGLSRRDLPPAISLFKGVRVAAGGELEFAGDPSPGCSVTLRAEMDLLVTLANCPHRLDPRDRYVATPIRVSAWSDVGTPQDDPVRTSTPELTRAFENAEALRAELRA